MIDEQSQRVDTTIRLRPLSHRGWPTQGQDCHLDGEQGAVVGVVPDTHSGRPTSQYQWDTYRKWLIVIGLAQSTRPCTFGGFEKISIL